MKVANLIDITPEEIAKLEKLGYAGMNVNLATGRIDLVKVKEKENECGNHDCCYPSAEECCGCGHCLCDYEEEEYDEYCEDEEEDCDEDDGKEELKEELEECVNNVVEIISKILR